MVFWKQKTAETDTGIARCQSNLNMNAEEQLVGNAAAQSVLATSTPNTETSLESDELNEGVNDDGAEEKQGAEETIDLAELEGEKPEICQPFDGEAYEWVCSTPFPGAHAPLLYLGYNKAVDLANTVFGRPMNLAEAQCIVKPDGGIQTCHLTGVQFQPVKYLRFIPNDLRSRMEKGERFDQIELPWGGPFYYNYKTNSIMAFSGAVYHRDKNKYRLDRRSALVDIAMEMEKRGRRAKWGEPLDVVLAWQREQQAELDERKKKREEWQARKQKIAAIVGTEILGKK